MSRNLNRFFPKPSSALRRRPTRAWLIHAPSSETGLMHWLVCAQTIEQAWELAEQLPVNSGAVRQLGAIFDGSSWPDFSRKRMKECCHICTPCSVLMLEQEERMWEAWLEGKPAELRTKPARGSEVLQ